MTGGHLVKIINPPIFGYDFHTGVPEFFFLDGYKKAFSITKL
ncbi:MAG: hypothetical protein JWP94_496 [Mucilaginibacter sp.]|nr:hypothetical protein [Mucilaginibacter sp.]